jgi:hypothetical protein
MDLVDRDVDVFVVFVAVANGDVLVLRETQNIHKVFRDVLELFRVWAAILRVK